MNAQAIEKTSPLPASSEPLTPEGILQLGLGFWTSKTLLSAVELGVFTELGCGPLSVDDLMARIGLHRRSARDFLDALVALGMLERGSGCYANAPAADLFLDRNKQAYVGGMLEMANARLYPFWAGLTDALQTGKPQNEVKHGGDFFAGLYSDADRLAGFLKAMTGISVGSATAIAKKFPWAQYRTFADIGNGARRAGVASRPWRTAPASPAGGVRSSGGSAAFRAIHRPPPDCPKTASIFQCRAVKLLRRSAAIPQRCL